MNIGRKKALLWQQVQTWALFAAFFFLEILIDGSIFAYFLPKFIPKTYIMYIEYFGLIVVCLPNLAYCLVSYLKAPVKSVPPTIRNLSLAKKNQSQNITSLSQTNLNVSQEEKATCLSKICGFLDNFFKTSTDQNSSDKKPNFLFNSRLLNALPNNSISSTLGYHDSPLNKSITSIHTQQQLEELAMSNTMDSLTNSLQNSSLFINSSYNYDEEKSYKTGTAFTPSYKSENPLDQVKAFTASKIKSSVNSFNTKDSRNISVGFLSAGGVRATSTSPHSVRRYESEMNKIFKLYNVNISNLEEYELKLRVWLCNTIIRPLVQKIDETNRILSDKYFSSHLKIGQSSLDTIKSALSSKNELCNTFLPFILPYLRVHTNQNYLLQRIRHLAENVALENFRWNGGGPEFNVESNFLLKKLDWSEQLPTDSEIVWSLFCTYMDFVLSPCSISSSGEPLKPFSNAFAQKGDSSIQTSNESFFIRMVSSHPPVFEFVFNGGHDIISMNKDSGNLWLTLILFLAHIRKYNHSRIGHLNLSSISLNIFDL